MIKNNDIMKELNMKASTFYAMKKRKPRLFELVVKGLELEKMIKDNYEKDKQKETKTI
jgi:hypothetical protein